MISREQATSAGARSIEMSRVFDAPRDAVFRAWTDPQQWAQWFAPEPLTGRAETDPRPGGSYEFVMIDQDGSEYTSVGVYQEIVEPERIVYSDSVDQMPSGWIEMLNEARGAEKGAKVPDGLATVTFEDVGGGRTKMTFHEDFDSKATRDAYVEMQMIEGLDAGFDNLERQLAKAPSISR